MSRIFSDSFQRVTARIDRAHERQPKVDTRQAKTDFEQLLRDIEKSHGSKELPSAPPAPRPLETPPSDMLSNLTFHEQVGFDSQTVGELQPPPKRQVSREEAGSLSVKSLLDSVKSAAPAAPPRAPQLISGQWTRDGASGEVSLNQDEIKDVIHTAGKYHGVDPTLTLAVARAESAFDPRAVSSDGHDSKGLFQLLDSTGRDMLSRFGVGEDYDPFNPSQNSFLGVGYLRRLHDIFSENSTLTRQLSTHPARSAADLEKLAVAAFNTGEGNVARAQARALAAGKDPSLYSSVEAYLPGQTRDYVARVMRYRLAMNDEGTA